MIAAAALLLAGQTIPPTGSSALAASPAFERPIGVPRAGRVAVRLDRAVYESARPDLGDLRVVDGAGALVPFLIDRGCGAPRPFDVRPSIRNRGWRKDGSATAVLDFGDRVRKDRLRLTLSGDNFRRRVGIEGSEDGEAWTTLVEEAWVFAVPGREPARYETVDLPENDFPLLRMSVHAGEGEREHVAIRDAALPARSGPLLHEQGLAPAVRRAEDARAHETVLTLDLGARWQPFDAVLLEVEDARFFREATLEMRREASRPGPEPTSWCEIGRGALYRLGHDGRGAECLRLDASGRARVLRVRLRNGDDRPLAIRAVSARAPVERIAFEAPAAGSYRLQYGAPSWTAPSFDLVRTVGDVPAWAGGASEVTAGAVVPLSTARGPAPPWTERHPALLWAGLLAVVAALGALTLRALRAAP